MITKNIAEKVINECFIRPVCIKVCNIDKNDNNIAHVVLQGLTGHEIRTCKITNTGTMTLAAHTEYYVEYGSARFYVQVRD